MAHGTANRAAHLRWISDEIDRHKGAIRALEALRDSPDVLEAAIERGAVGYVVPVAGQFKSTSNLAGKLANAMEGFPPSDDVIADAICAAMPAGQKARIATLVDRITKEGTAVNKHDVQRVLGRFSDRFEESSRGWWGRAPKKGGKRAQES